jgi:hypothetical protein
MSQRYVVSVTLQTEGAARLVEADLVARYGPLVRRSEVQILDGLPPETDDERARNLAQVREFVGRARNAQAAIDALGCGKPR